MRDLGQPVLRIVRAKYSRKHSNSHAYVTRIRGRANPTRDLRFRARSPLKRLIIDADDESEERPESKVMRVFKQAALLWTYEDPQGVYMLAHLRMPAGTHISHAQYCSQWLEVQITAVPPTDASISMTHDKDPAAVQYSSKVIPLKICPPKGMEFDEGVIPIKKWVDLTGAPFVPSGSKQDRCVPRMACFKLMFKRAPPSLESWGEEM